MRANTEGDTARAAVKGISSKNPLRPRKGMLTNNKPKKETPLKVKSTRITTEEPTKVNSERVTTEENLPPLKVQSWRTNTPSTRKAIGEGQRSLPAPPTKKASKPRKPRDIKYTQPTLPGMRNTRQFKGKSGKP
jgi:hypothetical protein